MLFIPNRKAREVSLTYPKSPAGSHSLHRQRIKSTLVDLAGVVYSSNVNKPSQFAKSEQSEDLQRLFQVWNFR